MAVPRLSLWVASLVTVSLLAVGCGGGGSNGEAPAPTVTLTADSTNLTLGESTTLRWQSTNADTVVSCTFGATSVSGEVSVSPAETTVYEIRVSGPGGEASASVTVTVAPADVTGPDGGMYVWVPPGEFMMGSNDGRDDEQPVHLVRIMRGFWLGKHEVTNAQYRAFCDATGREFPSASDQGDNHPVVMVSWDEAKAYCDHYGLRLPTEAEWEYAARGPEGRRYPWGDEWDPGKLCWYANTGPGNRTFPVGSFPAGASWRGALDMAGNVWEWCADWFGEGYYGTSPVEDPQGPATGEERLLRGGSWIDSPGHCRSAGRGSGNPRGLGYGVGFRCVWASG